MVRVAESLIVYRLAGREKVEEEGRCRLCQRLASARPLTRHHIVSKSWCITHGLKRIVRDSDNNIVPLCRPCHDDVDAHEGQEWHRSRLRAALSTQEMSFAIQLRGEDWFNRFYPVAVVPDAYKDCDFQAWTELT